MSVGKRETDDWIEDHRKAWKRVRKCVDMKPSKRKTVQNGTVFPIWKPAELRGKCAVGKRETNG